MVLSSATILHGYWPKSINYFHASFYPRISDAAHHLIPESLVDCCVSGIVRRDADSSCPLRASPIVCQQNQVAAWPPPVLDDVSSSRQ